MNRVELEGVLAHELSHIRNYDILVMTLTVTMVGIIALLSDFFLRFMFWTVAGPDATTTNNNPLGIVFAIFGFVLLIFAPIIAYVMQFAVSRKREYLADASGVQLTRYPPGLISALEKLKDDHTSIHFASKATAHLWIEEPLDKESNKGHTKWNHLFDTHPPLDDRIHALRGDVTRSVRCACVSLHRSVCVASSRCVVSRGAAACGGGGKHEAGARRRRPPRRKPEGRAGRAAHRPARPERRVARSARAVTVKINNTQRGQPKYGVDQADVVYEEVVEGGITRLAAIFNSHAPDRVGPVRSVRKTDQSIVWPIGGVFAYSGGAPYAIDIDQHRAGRAARRDARRAADVPRSLAAARRGTLRARRPACTASARPVPPPPLFTYRAAGAPVGGYARRLGAASGSSAASRSPGRGTRRAARGSARSSAAPRSSPSGTQFAPKNVVVMFVAVRRRRSEHGNEGAEAVLTGTGKAHRVHRGQGDQRHVVAARQEPSPRSCSTAAATSIALTPGQTWVELPDAGYSVTDNCRSRACDSADTPTF